MTVVTADEATSRPSPPQDAVRAVVQRRYGTADVLELDTIDRPTISSDEVLVEVESAGVDRGVVHLMTGEPYLIRLMGFGLLKPKQTVPGLDVAGRVVAVGDRVTRFRAGDEVFGIARGSFSGYAAAAESKLVRKPAAISFDHAGVAAISGGTALQALEDVGRLQPGQTVLVIGASGGVGTYAVQLAVALGGIVTGVCSTSKVELVRSLGAQRVIDYQREDLAVEGVGYDLVIDIGGRTRLSRLRQVMAARGTLVIVGGEGGGRFTGGIGRQLRAVMLSPFVRQRLAMFISAEDHTIIERLAVHLATGDVVPVVGRRVTLAGVPDAIRAMEAGDVRGKVVVTVGGAS